MEERKGGAAVYLGGVLKGEHAVPPPNQVAENKLYILRTAAAENLPLRKRAFKCNRASASSVFEWVQAYLPIAVRSRKLSKKNKLRYLDSGSTRGSRIKQTSSMQLSKEWGINEI
ncbi:hypothetical protein COP2_005422 [Malus domestica]